MDQRPLNVFNINPPSIMYVCILNMLYWFHIMVEFIEKRGIFFLLYLYIHLKNAWCFFSFNLILRDFYVCTSYFSTNYVISISIRSSTKIVHGYLLNRFIKYIRILLFLIPLWFYFLVDRFFFIHCKPLCINE